MSVRTIKPGRMRTLRGECPRCDGVFEAHEGDVCCRFADPSKHAGAVGWLVCPTQGCGMTVDFFPYVPPDRRDPRLGAPIGERP
jgi:hypothetical protein